MNRLFGFADQFLKESDWKDIALLKFCLCAMGILIGCTVGERQKKKVMAGAGIVFLVTYIPLIVKCIRILLRKDWLEEAEQELEEI